MHRTSSYTDMMAEATSAAEATRARRRLNLRSERKNHDLTSNTSAKNQEPKKGRKDPLSHFRHKPLDHEKPSIRLIKVLPNLSPTNCIQCTVRHSDVAAEYTCLSYVWGDEDNDHSILINGGLFRVRPNLWAFLSEARRKKYSTPLWIDALCIDQTNIAERNHQVQHMDQIFSRAIKVVAWLGNDPDIVACLSSGGGETDMDTEFFYTLDYWSRAWITQEIALARSVTFMSGPNQMSMDTLLRHSSRIPDFSHVHDMLRTRATKGRPLISLLQTLTHMQCKTKRDRIYSLLGICGEGSGLKPDYGISDEEVLIQTLQSCSKSLCFCTMSIIEGSLELNALPSNVSRLLGEGVFAETQLTRTIRRGFGHTCYLPLGGLHLPSSRGLPSSWGHGKGSLFCLHLVCPIMGGHLFFPTDLPEHGCPFYLPQHGWKAQNNRYIESDGYLKKYSIDGVHLSHEADTDTYTLQFTFDALIKMAHLGYVCFNGFVLGRPSSRPRSANGSKYHDDHLERDGRLKMCC